MHNLNWKKIDQVEKVDQRVAPGTAWQCACCMSQGKERKTKKPRALLFGSLFFIF